MFTETKSSSAAILSEPRDHDKLSQSRIVSELDIYQKSILD